MKYTAQFFYGSSYSAPTGQDVEHFSSLRQIGETLWRRADFDPAFPCVESAAASALVWKGELEDVTDVYPYRQIDIGPRGGIRILSV